MKEIFLSFKPEYFKPILYGMKKYEYRKRFCSKETKAYLYLSSNKRMVIGVMYLGVPIRLDKRRNEFKDYPETLKRVDKYIDARDICAVPIKSLSLFESPLTLSEIRESIPDFFPPRMYYVLDENSKLFDILHERKLKECEFTHKHDDIYYDNLALSVSEMMKTERFKKIDAVIDKMSDYEDIL